MKKGQRFYSATYGLITVVDGRRRVDDEGDAYMLVRDENGMLKCQWLGHQLIALDDGQWAAIRRLCSSHYLLRQFVIDQFRLGNSPVAVGNNLQAAADQLLHNRGE